MTEHERDDRRAELLSRIESGELDRHAPEVSSYLSSDPDFAIELDALLDLAASLSPTLPAAPAEAESEPPVLAPGEIRRLVERELGTGNAPGSARENNPPPRTPLAWALGAAAIVLVGLAISGVFGTGAGPDPLPPIAPDSLKLNDDGLWPSGEIARTRLIDEGFVWEGVDAVPGARFRVVIRANDQTVLESDWIRADRWSGEGLADLPSTFRWELQVRAPGRTLRPWSADVVLR